MVVLVQCERQHVPAVESLLSGLGFLPDPFICVASFIPSFVSFIVRSFPLLSLSFLSPFSFCLALPLSTTLLTGCDAQRQAPPERLVGQDRARLGAARGRIHARDEGVRSCMRRVVWKHQQQQHQQQHEQHEQHFVVVAVVVVLLLLTIRRRRVVAVVDSPSPYLSIRRGRERAHRHIFPSTPFQ